MPAFTYGNSDLNSNMCVYIVFYAWNIPISGKNFYSNLKNGQFGRLNELQP